MDGVIKSLSMSYIVSFENLVQVDQITVTPSSTVL